MLPVDTGTIIAVMVVLILAVCVLEVLVVRVHRKSRRPRVARSTHEPATLTTRRRPVFVPTPESLGEEVER